MSIKNLVIGLTAFSVCLSLSAEITSGPLQVSGVYPHLAVFNEGDGAPCHSDGDECGIGAIVPWADKLWMITYSPHCLQGSSDKLYSIDNNLQLTTHPQSVGGTPANRMIHRESNQLIIGPYLIDAQGKIRVIPPKSMPGRLTATARHLKHPERMVYFIDMEGMIYEADVYTLAVKKLFHKPVPGWHGKGGYTAQDRLIISNNGEKKVFNINTSDLKAGGAPQSDEDMGVLASWDGIDWTIIERKQFTDVTGPGGIYGAPDDTSPAWTIGWDKRSVILKVLENGKWSDFRLPKSTHTYDHWGGWYTEWPRIREVDKGQYLMDMHGMFYSFPKEFTATHASGIHPLANHLRYIPDFCAWNGRLVLATDETSILENPLAGQSQSNLWFGSVKDMENWGPANGWGGPWMNDAIRAATASDPLLMNGFDYKVLHLTAEAGSSVTFHLEIDPAGKGQWEPLKEIIVPDGGYESFVLPDNLPATWARLTADTDCTATAYFHLQGQTRHPVSDPVLFAALADIESSATAEAAWIRPAGHNKNLYIMKPTTDPLTAPRHTFEVNEHLHFIPSTQAPTSKTIDLMKPAKDFQLDAASVIVEDSTGKFRIPRTSIRYDQPFPGGWPRGKRELQSERYMLNAHGTFYEVPREGGFARMRPITTHQKQITDFCTWRGLLVLAGTRPDANNDGHCFTGTNPGQSLWFGAIDDLWKLGKPTGSGGPWKDTQVKTNEISLPYLMTGYDKKQLTLSADRPSSFTLEINFDHHGWHRYKTFQIPGNKPLVYYFPKGFNAHWIRIIAHQEAKATAWLEYN